MGNDKSATRIRKTAVYQMTVTALFSALMCILGPMAIPIGPVPVSLTNLVVYLAVYLLGARMGTVSYLIYLAIGAFGLPVFSQYSGGLSKLTGPTGGYLIGFIPMAVIIGIAIAKWPKKPVVIGLSMVLGTLVAYALGTVWFVRLLSCDLWYALTVCVFPFIGFDGIKIVIAVILGNAIRKQLVAAGFFE